MASTLLTLDKFTYSTKSSLTDYNLNNNLLLVVNRDNRNQTIESFLKNVDDGLCSALKHSKWSIEEFFPNEDISSTIAYKYLEDVSTLHLFECESDFEIIFVKTNENKFSINLHYNSYLYSSKYIETFLNAIKLVISSIVNCNISKTRLKDISISGGTFQDFDDDIERCTCRRYDNSC